ncbi:hypothetical protein EI94DRAFT_1748149 [Lactarius quietus]|nr:hypothetical protein EI94DRAFT_1748149 [Lactarius quietus]
MADHLVPSQPANPCQQIHAPSHCALHRLDCQNPHVARDDQQGSLHREGAPQPMGNVVMQDEVRYPQHIDTPNYNPAQYYPPPPQVLPQYPEDPHMHMHWNVGAAGAAPAAEAYPFAPGPEVQVNHDGLYGYAAHFPAVGPPEAFPGVWPQPAPPADMPEVNVLKDVIGRFLNNPGTHVNVFRIERGPHGRFEVWIALELADILRF